MAPPAELFLKTRCMFCGAPEQFVLSKEEPEGPRRRAAGGGRERRGGRGPGAARFCSTLAHAKQNAFPRPRTAGPVPFPLNAGRGNKMWL